jgi:hypothetical protein
MPGITINLDGDAAFKTEAETYGKGFHFHEDPAIKIARLPNGMASGKSSVAIGFEHEGKYIVIQTTLALLKSAVRTMETRDRMEGRPE